MSTERCPNIAESYPIADLGIAYLYQFSNKVWQAGFQRIGENRPRMLGDFKSRKAADAAIRSAIAKAPSNNYIETTMRIIQDDAEETPPEKGRAIAAGKLTMAEVKEDKLTDLTVTTTGANASGNSLAVQVLEVPVEVVTDERLTEGEARKIIDRIHQHIGDVRYELLRLYDGEGWKALGYKSWRGCVEAEFGQKQNYLYKLLNAAEVERNICTIVQKSEPLPETHARVLAELTPEQQREVYAEAIKTADGKLTAKHIEETKARIIPREQRKLTKQEKEDDRRTVDWAATTVGDILKEWPTWVKAFLNKSCKPQHWAMVGQKLNDSMQQIVNEFIPAWVEEAEAGV
jgi:hypothetical protein